MVTNLFAEAEASVTTVFSIRPPLSSVFCFLFFCFFTNVKTHCSHFHLAEILNRRTQKNVNRQSDVMIVWVSQIVQAVKVKH